jgi:protein ImuA
MMPDHTAELRKQIARIERATIGAPTGSPEAVISAGAAEIDAALPWGGLPVNGLHEVFGDATATGFAASLLARLDNVKSGAPILWCQTGRELYGPGIAAYGLDPNRLILVHGRNDTDLLWAMEEGLAAPGIAGVVGVLHKVPPIAGRRLQLAAEERGRLGLLLRPLDPLSRTRAAADLAATSMALSRWRVGATPSEPLLIGGREAGMGPERWRLELQRCRLSSFNQNSTYAGHPKTWQVEWRNETGDLSVVAALRDGSVEPADRWRAAS